MRALVRRPSSRLADGEVTHISRQPVDLRLATLQWEIYVGLLQQHGWDIVEVAPADEHPDSVFIEDTVVMFDTTAVITNPGAASRQGEIDGVRATVESLGLSIASITTPGRLDGGDVLKVGRTCYVGSSARTNGEAIRQLRQLFSPAGWDVVAVPLSKVLHLKSAITALPDGTIIGWPDALDSTAMFPRFLAMPEESGAHVVDLGDGNLLISADAVDSQSLLQRLGYRTVAVDIGEFVKLEGCVTCLSVRMRAT